MMSSRSRILVAGLVLAVFACFCRGTLFDCEELVPEGFSVLDAAATNAKIAMRITPKTYTAGKPLTVSFTSRTYAIESFIVQMRAPMDSNTLGQWTASSSGAATFTCSQTDDSLVDDGQSSTDPVYVIQGSWTLDSSLAGTGDVEIKYTVVHKNGTFWAPFPMIIGEHQGQGASSNPEGNDLGGP